MTFYDYWASIENDIADNHDNSYVINTIFEFEITIWNLDLLSNIKI